MNSSLWSADFATHVKIVAVAALAAVVFVVVGLNGQADNPNSKTAMIKSNGPAMKAARPANITANDLSRVR